MPTGSGCRDSVLCKPLWGRWLWSWLGEEMGGGTLFFYIEYSSWCGTGSLRRVHGFTWVVGQWLRIDVSSSALATWRFHPESGRP